MNEAMLPKFYKTAKLSVEYDLLQLRFVAVYTVTLEDGKEYLVKIDLPDGRIDAMLTTTEIQSIRECVRAQRVRIAKEAKPDAVL